MSDYPETKARDKATLEQQIMDANIAKNDAEWWARGEIERLLAEIQQLHGEYPIARNNIIEQCARVVDDAPIPVTLSNIAAAIRALKDKQP